ncbi:MAG: hypothetical protein NTY04_00240, partial [Candidatus Staskawiczbacteria bacterium]|nr:hypothetical protein [Candidatus Staskawiczbacteria bacterium]
MKTSIVVALIAALFALPVQAGTNDTDNVSISKDDYKSQRLLSDFSQATRKHLASMVDIVKSNVKMIVRVAQERSKITPAVTSTVLDGVTGLCGTLHIGGDYGEVIGLLIEQAKGEKLPDKPTQIQQRLIKAGNGSIEDMAKEAIKCLD